MSEYQIWEEEREQAWHKMLDMDAHLYAENEPEEEFGHDDSEEFRWEHEHKARLEARGHTYTPSNWSECYEREIMGRSNDSYSGLYQGGK